MDFVQKIIQKRANDRKLIKKFEDFSTGDTVKVFSRVKEGEKERVQMYRGVVIKIQGAGFGKSFTVRKMSSGIGVERTFPFASPKLERIEVVNRGQVRRSKLYYLRALKGRAARLSSELVAPEEAATDVASDALTKEASATEKA
jgi:large subunit ribosomal protein L19